MKFDQLYKKIISQSCHGKNCADKKVVKECNKKGNGKIVKEWGINYNYNPQNSFTSRISSMSTTVRHGDDSITQSGTWTLGATNYSSNLDIVTGKRFPMYTTCIYKVNSKPIKNITLWTIQQAYKRGNQDYINVLQELDITQDCKVNNMRLVDMQDVPQPEWITPRGRRGI